MTRATAATLVMIDVAAAGCAATANAPRDTAVPSEPDDQPMAALDGYRDGKDFFVKYRQGERILYAGGSWRDRVEGR